MRYSRLFGKTVRTAPKDATIISHKLLYRAGFLRELASGRYSLLPLGYRVRVKMEKIIEEEMNAIGGQRVTTPTLHPIEFWKKTNRTNSFGPTLMRVKDRRGSEFALGATHEEVFTDLVINFNLSEKDLPVILYQFSNKFRDEQRARGGLLRLREFLMKDAYSFHATPESIDKTYKDMYNAYLKIFKRFGIEALPVEADSGAIGGKVNHEFMMLTPAGEDTIVVCPKCNYAANQEKSECLIPKIDEDEKEKPMAEIPAVDATTIEKMSKLYNKPAYKMMKTVVYKVNGKSYVGVVIRGDLNVNEVKLAKALNSSDIVQATDEEVIKLGTIRGFISPVGIKKIRFIADHSIKTVKNLYTGSNRKDVDLENVNYPRDYKVERFADLVEAQEGLVCIKCKEGKLQIKRGIEIGHVFRLDYYYSEPMNATFTATDGTLKKYFMGCYGIGLERNLAAIVESHHDEKGIIWTTSVAPFDIHLIGINLEDEKIRKYSERVYEELKNKGFDVLYDDREDSAGVKFADADLIGIPTRLIISKKTLQENSVEYKKRNEKETKLVKINKLSDFLTPR